MSASSTPLACERHPSLPKRRLGRHVRGRLYTLRRQPLQLGFQPRFLLRQLYRRLFQINIQVRLRQALSGAGGRFADVPEVGLSHACVNLQLRETNIAPCDAAVAVPRRSHPTASDKAATTLCGSRPGPGKEDQGQTEKNYGAGREKHRAMDREQREILQKLESVGPERNPQPYAHDNARPFALSKRFLWKV